MSSLFIDAAGGAIGPALALLVLAALAALPLLRIGAPQARPVTVRARRPRPPQ